MSPQRDRSGPPAPVAATRRTLEFERGIGHGMQVVLARYPHLIVAAVRPITQAADLFRDVGGAPSFRPNGHRFSPSLA